MRCTLEFKRLIYFRAKGSFTVSVCVGDRDRDVVNKWEPLIPMVPFTLSNAKQQMKNRRGNRSLCMGSNCEQFLNRFGLLFVEYE